MRFGRVQRPVYLLDPPVQMWTTQWLTLATLDVSNWHDLYPSDVAALRKRPLRKTLKLGFTYASLAGGASVFGCTTWL